MSGLAEELRPEDEAVRSLHGKVREVSGVGGGDGGWSVLEVLMLLGTLRLSFYHSGKGFGYALGIDAAPEATLEILCDASLLLSGRERAKSERGRAWGGAGGCVAIDGGIGG